MPFDPMQNIFLQQANQMPPDQAQVAANGTPVSLMSNEQYNQMKQGKVPMAPAMPAQNTDLGDDEKAKSQMGIAKFLEAAAPKTAAPQAASAPQSEMDKYLAAAQQSRDEQSGRFDQMQKYIDSLRGQKKGGIDSIDWTPLAALADAMNGGKTNLAASARAMAPTSQEDKDKYVNGLQNQLFDKQNKLSQENLEAIGKKLQMDKANAQFAETMRHNRATEDNGATKAQGMDGRVGVMLGNQAIAAGQAFEKDPILRSSKVSLNSLTRSSSILNNPNKPVTSKDLNLAYNDYINAVAAGGAATEGKIARELPETFEQKLNEFKQRFGDNEDMRKSGAGQELVKMLHENIRTVRGDLGQSIADQAHNLETSYGGINNPMVHKIVQAKMDQYGNAEKNAVDNKALAEGRAAPGMAAVGPHGATVTQNGHTYTWNPSTGKYE